MDSIYATGDNGNKMLCHTHPYHCTRRNKVTKVGTDNALLMLRWQHEIYETEKNTLFATTQSFCL